MLRIIVLILCCSFLFCSEESNSCDLLKKTIKQFNKVVDFISTDWSHIELDGLFGIKMASDVMDHLNLKNIELICAKKESRRLIENLQMNQQELKVLSVMMKENVKQNSQKYFKRFKFLLSEEIYSDEMKSLPVMGNQVESSSAFHEGNSDFNENRMDRCYIMLQKRCKTSEDCQKILFENPKSQKYLLTHQILYHILYKKKKCFKYPGSVMNGDQLESNITTSAVRLYSEIDIEMKLYKNTQDPYAQDIILEQIIIGSGMLGYKNFMRKDWFKYLASWQNMKYGCFGIADDTIQTQRRRLLRDKKMLGDCSSHTTGIGTSFLTLYLKLLLAQ